MTMNKPEMEFVRFDGADIITTSGGDGLVRLFNFGDGVHNAVFTYGFDDPEQGVIYTAPYTGIVAADLVAALNAALGVSNVTTDKLFINTSNMNWATIENLPQYDSQTADLGFNGAYKWDDLGTGAGYHFYKQ